MPDGLDSESLAGRRMRCDGSEYGGRASCSQYHYKYEYYPMMLPSSILLERQVAAIPAPLRGVIGQPEIAWVSCDQQEESRNYGELADGHCRRHLVPADLHVQGPGDRVYHGVPVSRKLVRFWHGRGGFLAAGACRPLLLARRPHFLRLWGCQ